MSVVTVERLAAHKRLESARLIDFGLRDESWGVRIPYTLPTGGRARGRRRLALRGVDGSSWDPDETLPRTVYSHRDVVAFVDRAGYQIIVEGESDCWVAWSHGLPAVGIPGSTNVDLLELQHLYGATAVFIQIESDNPRTYPLGVMAYVEQVKRKLGEIGYDGPVRTLAHQGASSDIGDLYVEDPTMFLTNISNLIEASSLSPSREDTR